MDESPEMPTPTLEDILTRLKGDDKSALKDLFQQYYLPVCQTIHRFIRDKNLAEDLAQNVFLRFWEKRHQVTVTTSAGAYLRRMAINEALAWLRRKKRVDFVEPDSNAAEDIAEGVEEQFLQNELQGQITNAINALPPKRRAIFQLSRFEGLTYKEIAEKLGISVKTVENQMGKALRVLREKLKGYLSISM